MSEVDSRTRGRGRGTYRGGRGGYRGTRTGGKVHSKNDEQEQVLTSEPDDQGEMGELKQRYGGKVSLLREVCPDWSVENLVYALKETDGDENLALERISNGTSRDHVSASFTDNSAGSMSQWGEVKKKQPKAKESTLPGADLTNGSRGARGRGTSDGRGRGRATERSRGRGGRATSHANEPRSAEKMNKPSGDDSWGDTAATTTTASGDWQNGAAETAATGDWANEANQEAAQPPKVEPVKHEVAATTTKKGGWAGLFAKPPPAPPVQTPPAIPVAQPGDLAPVPAIDKETPMESTPAVEGMFGAPSATGVEQGESTEAPIQLTPSKDELTEENLEQIPDVSHPPLSHTAASTVASTQDPLSSMKIATPAIRPGMSGYAASALKATAGGGRSASFQRKLMEQHESVVMPSHNQSVESTAVQFGRMGMNGDQDVDEEREDPETRTQLLDDSPAAPRASLPSLTQANEAATQIQPQPLPPGIETQSIRQAPGLPPAQQPPQSASPPVAATYADQYRYAQPGQKSYDPFSQQQMQQPQTQSQGMPQSLEPFSNQLPGQSQGSAAQDYSSYYGANAREAYQNYYATYGQSQDAQPRTGSAFGTSAQDAQSLYATSRPQNTYGATEPQGSGHNTPNPALQGHQGHHSQQMPPGQSYAGYGPGYGAYAQQYAQYGNFPAGHRYGPNRPQFDDVRRQDSGDYYANQYAYSQNQHYGGGYSKANMYPAGQQQQQQQYAAYEHSASPANAGGYAQTGMGNRENTYGRAGSAQLPETQQSSSHAGYGGMADPFGRSHSGFGQQHTGSEETSKYETSKASGPSPAMGQAGRPGSALNSQSQQSTAFPPPQAQTGQQAFGGYPQYASHQAQGNHPQSAYSGYGSNTFANTYGQYGSGRGYGSYGTGQH